MEKLDKVERTKIYMSLLTKLSNSMSILPFLGNFCQNWVIMNSLWRKTRDFFQNNKDQFSNLLSSNRGYVDFDCDFNEDVSEQLLKNDIFRCLNLKIDILTLEGSKAFVTFLDSVSNHSNLKFEEIVIK